MEIRSFGKKKPERESDIEEILQKEFFYWNIISILTRKIACTSCTRQFILAFIPN